MSQLRLRPLGFGEILDGAFTLYRNHFSTFFATALLAAIPIAMLTRPLEQAMIGSAPGDPLTAAFVGAVLFALPLSGLTWLLLWGALTRQTAETYEGRLTSVADGYRRALRVLPRFIVAGFLILILGTALFLAFTVGLVVLALPLTLLGEGDLVAVLYGSMVLIGGMAAAVLAMTSLFAVMPAMVVEGAGPWTAIKRSHALAGGARLRIAGITVVSTLIVLLPTLGLAVAAGLGAAMWDAAAAATLSPVQIFMQQFIAILSSALTTPFMVACFTLLYFDRRVRAEGYDLEAAAEALSEPVLR